MQGIILMQQVEIKVEGHIDKGWSEWLEYFVITHTDENETILIGTIPDQAALYGLIAKLRDLGLSLISVNLGRQQIIEKDHSTSETLKDFNKKEHQ